MKKQILKLREEGKTYDQIVEIVGCSKGTISYHCGKGQKEKTLNRSRKNRKSAKGAFRVKLSKFLRYKVKNFKTGTKKIKNNTFFDYSTAYKKISENPVCYLTGDDIDLSKTLSYELDHIIPSSKGGKNSLENMGLTIKEANRAKDDMMLEDFILLCKKVCEYNGYKVIKK